MDNAEAKSMRLLMIYARLVDGEVLKKSNLAAEFGVTQRSIQRDVESLRVFLSDEMMGREVVYDTKSKGYILDAASPTGLTNSEILAVCKILLESRSMRNDEMMPILDKLLDCCIPESNKKAVKKLIANEQYHYIAPQHNKHILNGLWEIGQAVEQNRIMKIEYQRTNGSLVNRTIEPAGLLFSEYYFYLLGFLRDINKQQCFENPNDLFPTIYRIDIGYCECLPFNDENNLEIVMEEIEKIVIKNKQDTYTEQSKKMQYFIVWTLLNFAHIDEKITQSEEKVIFYLIDFWNMDKILVSNMFDTLNTVSLLQKQIEFLKTTDMPYEKTHSHIEQCEKEIKQIYKDIEITLA